MCRLPLFVLMSILWVFTGAIAPSTQALPENQDLGSQVLFRPSGRGRPPTTRGAGSRNDLRCPQDAPTNSSDFSTQPLTLTALVPTDQAGLTWLGHPTFWVYVPKTAARQIVLSIKDAGSQAHSQRFLPITGEAGVVEIPMDKTTSPLEIGKFYQWAVVLICGDRPSPNDPYVTGWVSRVTPFPAMKNSQTALERAAFYGNQGIWYDALTTLAEIRRLKPTDPTLEKIWVKFLAEPSVGLGSLADKPLR